MNLRKLTVVAVLAAVGVAATAADAQAFGRRKNKGNGCDGGGYSGGCYGSGYGYSGGCYGSGYGYSGGYHQIGYGSGCSGGYHHGHAVAPAATCGGCYGGHAMAGSYTSGGFAAYGSSTGGTTMLAGGFQGLTVPEAMPGATGSAAVVPASGVMSAGGVVSGGYVVPAAGYGGDRGYVMPASGAFAGQPGYYGQPTYPYYGSPSYPLYGTSTYTNYGYGSPRSGMSSGGRSGGFLSNVPGMRMFRR